MTFLEKLKEDNPNLTEDEIMKRVLHSCPYVYGYGGETVNSKCMNVGSASSHCVECWNREMPDTEQLTEKREKMIDAMSENAYNKGLNDAWELVKKIILTSDRGGITTEALVEVFGTSLCSDVLVECTPQEALAKLKAYEEAQKIEVGDVVEIDDDEIIGVVTYIKHDGCIDGFDTLGIVFQDVSCDRYKKTGKHIDIQSILSQIGGE